MIPELETLKNEKEKVYEEEVNRITGIIGFLKADISLKEEKAECEKTSRM